MKKITKSTVSLLALLIILLYMHNIYMPGNTKKCDLKKEKPELKLYKITVKQSEKIEFFPYVPIERIYGKTNEARIVGKGQCVTETRNHTSDNLDMIGVTNYIPVDILRKEHSMYSAKLRRIPNDDDLNARIAEITTSYQANLNHPYLKRLYIFVQHKESSDFLHSLDFENSSKLVIVWIDKKIEVKDELLYISKCFQNRVVIKFHQDNRLGVGFDKVKPSVFVKHNVMYALTRHSPYERHCSYATNYGVCDPKAFSGSHDAFMFYVKEFTEEHLSVLKERNIEAHEEGMENVFVWIFRKKLNYKVINPCLVLHVHHEHCVPIRHRHRRRVDKNHSNQASPTKKLF